MPSPTDRKPQSMAEQYHLGVENPADTTSLMQRIIADYWQGTRPPAVPVHVKDLFRDFQEYADWWIYANVTSIGEELHGTVLRLVDGTPLLLTNHIANEQAQSELPPEPPTVQLNRPGGGGVPAYQGRGERNVQHSSTVHLNGVQTRRPRQGQ